MKYMSVNKTIYKYSEGPELGTIFGTKKKITKKQTQAGGVGNQHLPLALSVFLQQSLQIFGIHPLPRRRFLQHYYRGTFIESHRKPIEVPQISYGGPETCKSLFLYQRYTKGIEKASIYLKTKSICITQNKSLSLQRKIRKIISNSTSKCSKKSFHIISPHRLRIS